MTHRDKAMTAALWHALGGEASRLDGVTFALDEALPSAFSVTDLASASIAAAGLAVSDLKRRMGLPSHEIRVDRRLSSMWFRPTIRPVGWQLPPLWDAIAGDYRARDGWIRLHTNAPHHRLAALKVLGPHHDRQTMQDAVAGWDALPLETAVVKAGGCAAQMRTVPEWRLHEQGQAVSTEPLMDMRYVPEAGPARPRGGWVGTSEQPLLGLRVLDVTRVLAGPTATRFLAGYGAEVLRIDPLDWNEAGVIPDITLGKRCARLDLNSPSGRDRFEALLQDADILVHGLRNGALDALGYDARARALIAPGLIDVSLNAYGFTGPWARRRGFDSLVQMSSGIAARGMSASGENKPVPLPVQALDYATGYLLAAAVARGLSESLNRETGVVARTSLARMAQFLIEQGTLSEEEMASPPPVLAKESDADLASGIEPTSWGEARRLQSPLEVDGQPLQWRLPASDLGSAEAVWL